MLLLSQPNLFKLFLGLALMMAAAMPTTGAADAPATVAEPPAARHPDGPDSTATEVPSGSAQAGLAHFQAGRLDQAREAFEVAIKDARQAGNVPLWTALLINLGNVRSALGQFDEAGWLYSTSFKFAADAGFHAIAARALANMAKVAMFQGKRDSASQDLRSAVDDIQKLAENREKAELMLSVGHLLQQHGFDAPSAHSDGELAYQALSAGMKLAESLGQDDLRAYGYGYLGALYLAQDRLAEALALTGKAEFVAQSINRADILYRWQWQSGRILGRQGAKAEAVSAYRRAISTLQPIRQALRMAVAAPEPQGSPNDLYLEFADLLLQGKGHSDDDLSAVRKVIEQGKAAELEDYYRDDCVAAWLGKSSGIDRIEDKTAALYPILFPDRLEVLLSLPDGLKRYTTYQDRGKVTKEVEMLRATLENRGTPEYLPHAQALYDLLIRPLEPALAKNRIETLVFVPDAAFRTIPLAALHDGKDFLARRYAVATSPGLTLTDPQPIQRDSARALVLGLSEGSQGFPPLPNVQDEIREIAGQFPSTVLENQSFRVEAVERQLRETPYRIVHIASHGQFGKTAADTFVLAADGKLSLDGLGKMMGVSRYRSEPVELLTLSACQTAAGDGQAALGLAGVAVKAGARSALASLWFINDPASANLVEAFYRQLKQPGTSKAKALQKAQLRLLDDERYDHPGYWAPFLMIGNWL